MQQEREPEGEEEEAGKEHQGRETEKLSRR